MSYSTAGGVVDQQARTGRLHLVRVTHHPGQNPPLRAVVIVSGRSEEVPCSARHLRSFAAFQQHVADSLGFWARHDCQCERRSRDRQLAWDEHVSRAFDRGTSHGND